MSTDSHLSDDDLFALRVGRAMERHRDAFSDAISFKAGCTVVASMFGDVLESSSLVMSVIAVVPEITLHVDWHRDEVSRIIDSRERGFEEDVPPICAEPACWHMNFPDRMRVELRSRDDEPERVGGLETIASMLLPFLELSRRTDRLYRAMSLLEVAQTAVGPRSAASVSGEIVDRIGRGIGAPTAFFPVSDVDDVETLNPAYIYSDRLSERVSGHLFASFGRVPDGPVQRALASPQGAAPTTLSSNGLGAHGERINAMLGRLDVVDYVAVRVMHQNEPIGVLASVLVDSGESASPRGFTGNEVATVASSAFIAGWAIPLAEEQAKLRRSLQESEMLRHLAQISFQHKDRAETLSMASGVARIIFGADYVAIGTVDDAGELSKFRHVSGNQTEAHTLTRSEMFSKNVRTWLDHPNLTVIENLADRPHLTPEQFPILHSESLVTSIISPFETSDGTWIVLLIGFRNQQMVSEEDTRFAHALSQTIASAL
jgi:GAF domain-containing protein